MAIVKLNRGVGMPGVQSAATNPARAGEAHTILVTHTFDTVALATTDILELAVIPAHSRLVGLRINTENLPAGNFTLGLMTGKMGSEDPTRTSGSQIANAAPAQTELTVPLLALVAIPKSDGNISIGFKHSVAIPVAANRKVHVSYQITG